MKKITLFIFLFSSVSLFAQKSFDVDSALQSCVGKVKTAMASLTDSTRMPRNILKGQSHWNCTGMTDWTSGFWPGILWYCYEYSGDEEIRRNAELYSRSLFPFSRRKASDHDLGFQVFCSIGNGYRITRNSYYKNVLLRTADTLATLYNPMVGTVLSWPAMSRKNAEWAHNTIIDNMINLEMLFWAAKNGNNKHLYDIAFRHAEVTMNNQFRKDYSTCHVVLYDPLTGKRIRQVTNQGYNDESMWARGQAWAIYGFTMAYRETGDVRFLKTAKKALAAYLKNLPSDKVPYWDFNAPGIPDEPKDASAAAVVASALLELSQLTKTHEAVQYRHLAVEMLQSLSDNYSGRQNDAFLVHSTGNHPAGSEIDASIIYADYYYLEALLRLKKLKML